MPAPRMRTFLDFLSVPSSGRSACAMAGSNPSAMAARYTVVDPPTAPARLRKPRRESLLVMVSFSTDWWFVFVALSIQVVCQRELVNEGFLIGCEVFLGHGNAPQRVTIAASASAQGVGV